MLYFDPVEFLTTVFLGMVSTVILFWKIARYALRSYSLYTVAKRRALGKPWMAWLPVVRDWILGSVSDQYQYLTRGKIRYRRGFLLGLCAAGGVCTAAAVPMLIGAVLRALELADRYYSESQILAQLSGLLLAMTLVGAALLILRVAAWVLRCMCRYDLFRSCEPKNAIAYLVLGIVFAVTEPFFLLACCHKDLGMPPRRTQPGEDLL